MADEARELIPIRDVATSGEGETRFNTIALSGRDIVIPIEMDLAGDPLQDDEVRLVSAGGGYDQSLSPSDDDVEADDDAGVMQYRFRRVPYGAYRVHVRIGSEWTVLHDDLVVRVYGVSAAGKELDDERPAVTIAGPVEPEEPAPEEPPEPSNGEEDTTLFVDQVED
ncbi:MAG TPA: hypothetical protein VEB43_03905 [Anaeromyxobacter sp.]|nr:hypothetical protein [Anaeromyxobacter sp.]